MREADEQSRNTFRKTCLCLLRAHSMDTLSLLWRVGQGGKRVELRTGCAERIKAETSGSECSDLVWRTELMERSYERFVTCSILPQFTFRINFKLFQCNYGNKPTIRSTSLTSQGSRFYWIQAYITNQPLFLFTLACIRHLVWGLFIF